MIHAFTAIIWGWIHTYYPIFGGNEPSFTTYFDVRGFWCSLTMGDHGINVRISPAAAIAISSLWTPTFFGSDFDQGPRSFWLQRPSFCFCIQWQMYMYLSVCLSVCLSLSIPRYLHTHTLHTCKLVGGLEHLDFFSISQKWECHHPNWLFLYFSEGWLNFSTTNQSPPVAPGFRQALGSASMALLALAVWGGAKSVFLGTYLYIYDYLCKYDNVYMINNDIYIYTQFLYYI